MDNQANAFIAQAKYIVSACLAGLNTRYDCSNSLDERVRSLVAQGRAIPFCPEQAGGLPTPRVSAEIQGGDGAAVLGAIAYVATKDGCDVTGKFVRGAHEMVALAQIVGVTTAILKNKSPSCGCGAIYDGSFSGTMKSGDGVATALLKQAGIHVINEDEINDD